MEIKLSISKDLISQDDLQQEIDEIIKDATKKAAEAIYGKAVELASEKLSKSTLEKYQNALKIIEIQDGVFEVSLDPSADPIEEGKERYEMLPGLATGPASKQKKDGNGSYAVIPVEQGREGSSNTRQISLRQELQQLAKEGKFKEVKRGMNKNRFQIVDRLSKSSSHNVGENLKDIVRVREYSGSKNGSVKGRSPANTSFLKFRTASTDQDPSSHWVFPGTEGIKVFDEIEKWIQSGEFDQLINSLMEQ